MALLGESADREANLGEALMAEANGVVTIEAKAAFVRAVTLDNTIVRTRYYLGRAAEQDGKREEAAKIWRDLIAEAPAEAHWVNDVRAALARVEASPGTPTSAAPGTQSAAAAKPDQQAVMIRGMVDGLAARLKQDGSDVDGWLKLVRSYKVLGEQDKLQTAISDAQRALANDPDKRKLLDAGLKQLEGSAVAVANSPPQPASPVASPPQHEGDAIQSMVARLAERMKKSSSDPEGWIMLTRSYLSLGEREKAATAVKDAGPHSPMMGPTCNCSMKRCNGSRSMKRQTWHRLRLRLLRRFACACPSRPAEQRNDPRYGGASCGPSEKGWLRFRWLAAHLALVCGLGRARQSCKRRRRRAAGYRCRRGKAATPR